MSEKLHILSFSRGSWDDYHRINVGVFSDVEKAKEVGDKFLAKVEELRNSIDSECPLSTEERNRYEDECDFDFFEGLPPETQNKYHDWWYTKSMIYEINKEYRIDEFELDKPNLSDFDGISID